jgi:parallel beta-helix repeat protein
MRSYNFTVTGNAFNDCPTGIRLRSGDTAVVSSNTVRNAETAIDIDDSYTNNLQQGLNATR